MVENNDHDKFFCMMDKIMDKALSFEPRMQKVEFRTTILWWVLASIGSGVGALLIGYILWYVTNRTPN